jgi:hypothetical protein
MSTKSKKNSQARAEKRKRKEDRRRKQKAKAAQKNASRGSIGQRHRRQLESLVPRAWDGENPLDVAIFDEAVLAGLAGAHQNEVALVKKSLDLIGRGKLDEANEAVAEISRKSDLSDWRMLVRGITCWLANDFAAAEKSWSRLATDRRPARIAAALQLARRDDLADLAAHSKSSSIQKKKASGKEQTSDVDENSNAPGAAQPWDLELLKAARVVRRTRIDRAAIKIAAVGVKQQIALEDEIPDLTITSEKIQWLREFGRDFRGAEPNLVRALEVAALDRASFQPYTDVFNEAVKAFRGPGHDPRNLFRSFCYWMEDEDSESKAHDFLRKYVETDLPFNEQLSKPLRDAMTSTIWMNEAASEMARLAKSRSPFGFAFYSDNDGRETKKTIRENFKKSINAYPGNEPAHKLYVGWLEQEVDDGALTKKQRDQAVKQLTDAMQKWASAIPTAPQPRTYLAETFLEAEQFEDAAPHVQWIADSRPDDPRLKALPWKLKLFEAMNLCRRKSNLSQVPDVLAEVESLWPSWLSTRWLPYFNAAWLLRSGDQTGFEKQRETIYASGLVARSSLADACMMLGSAQRMKVTAADLKPLRQPVETAVKNLKQLGTEELLDAGSFFWEMYQAKVIYPAFRMHGSKFGRELLKRFKNNAGLLAKHIDEPAFQHSVFWFSEHRFWGDGYESKMPPNFRKLVTSNHFMGAAHLNAMNKVRYGVREAQLLETVENVKQAIRSETNPFYRFWFAELAEAAEEKVRQFEREFGGGDLGGMFGAMFGRVDEDDEDDEGECDCPECQARRERESARNKAAESKQKFEEASQAQDDAQARLF